VLRDSRDLMGWIAGMVRSDNRSCLKIQIYDSSSKGVRGQVGSPTLYRLSKTHTATSQMGVILVT